ncbi:MAG: histidinol dehydrogenase [Pirellulaceae bacterium]|nr:histidinol dehydrogenase [Pirellulaceae bacterium]
MPKNLPPTTHAESTLGLPILRADSEEFPQFLKELKKKLSLQGEVTSTEGQKKTKAIFGESLSPQEVVTKICGDIKENGSKALFDYSYKIDGAKVDSQTILVSQKELEEAHDQVETEYLETLRHITSNIETFQNALLCGDRLVSHIGAKLEHRYRPLRRVGLCVPGGAAAYPSSLLMTALPAKVAGVSEIAVMAPPTPYGANNLYLRAACFELGITELYRMGGTQGVASFAYGTKEIRKVDKIVGPGNLFVALAKRHVYGEVDIDSIAGPSEVVILADSTARASFLAADMIAQAEHSPGASVLITWASELVEKIKEELGTQLEALSRSELILYSLNEYGAIVLVDNADEGCRLANTLAPEHLHVSTEKPRDLLPNLTSAGALFLGHHTPVAVGDYYAGPSHVLPTSGTATWASGLSANDFLRSYSVLEYSNDRLQRAAPYIQNLAEKEGLMGHWESVRKRIE